MEQARRTVECTVHELQRSQVEHLLQGTSEGFAIEVFSEDVPLLATACVEPYPLIAFQIEWNYVVLGFVIIAQELVIWQYIISVCVAAFQVEC